MDRRDRNRNDYDSDYSRGAGYDRNDTHYHNARNLTNEFEQEYREHTRSGNDWDRNQPRRSYHEGNDMENTYQRLRRDDDSFRDRTDYMRNDSDSDRNYYGGSGRDRDSSSRDSYRGNMGMYSSGRDDEYQQRGSMQRGYGSSNQYSSGNRNEDRGDWGPGYRPGGSLSGGRMRDSYSGSDDTRSRFGGSNAGGTGYAGSYGTMGGGIHSSSRNRNYGDTDSFYGGGGRSDRNASDDSYWDRNRDRYRG